MDGSTLRSYIVLTPQTLGSYLTSDVNWSWKREWSCCEASIRHQCSRRHCVWQWNVFLGIIPQSRLPSVPFSSNRHAKDNRNMFQQNLSGIYKKLTLHFITAFWSFIKALLNPFMMLIRPITSKKKSPLAQILIDHATGYSTWLRGITEIWYWQ